jgi:WD40 repeat protein/tRNA A-37 threonylcarbamoyl transferase component Bud32
MSRNDGQNSLDDLERIDDLVDRFEDAWQAGTSSTIEDFLTGLTGGEKDAHRQLLIELVVIDMANRWQRHDQGVSASHHETLDVRGEAEDALPDCPIVGDYLDRFPLLGNANDVPVELVVEEYRVRRKCGEQPSHDEFRQRFNTLSSDLVDDLLAVDQQLDGSGPKKLADRDQMAETVNASSGQGGDTVVRPENETPIRSFGDYKILTEIARGGMGVVYKARQLSLNRTVALKMIKAGELASDEEVTRFRNEAQAAATLDHPHIVPVFEVGEQDGLYFFSMGFVDGDSLSELLREDLLPPRQAATLIRQVAEAIHYAHQQKVVHRDIKPGNILIDSKGEPRVTDFGLAKQVDSGQDLTTTGQVLGTPNFMAPEQAKGQTDVGPAADVYALGAVLYNALTGRPPFQSDSGIETIRQVIDDDPVSLRILNAKVDRDLETICLKCLEKDAAQRYKSAADLADDLRRWLSNESVFARRATVWERTVKWIRRRPAVAAATLASIVAVLALGAALAAAAYNNALAQSLSDTQAAKNETDDALGKLRTAQTKTVTALGVAEEANRQARRSDYFRRIALAQTEWDDGNVSAVVPLLNGCPEEFRQWEWHYLKRLLHQDWLTLRGGDYGVVSYSPDGNQIVTFDRERRAAGERQNYRSMIRIYDSESGQLVQHWAVDPTGFVLRSSLSPDGSVIAAGAYRDGSVRLWNLVGKEILSVDSAAPILRNFEFSPDGTQLALSVIGAGTWKVILVDTTTGVLKVECEAMSEAIHNIAFHPDGNELVVSTRFGKLLVFNAVSGSLTRTIDAHVAKVSSYRVSCLQFDSSGKRLASGAEDEFLKVWDYQTGKLIHEFRQEDQVLDTVFCNDGATLIAACADQTVHVWDLATEQRTKSMRGHRAFVTGVAVSPDAAHVASASNDGRVKVWDLDGNYEGYEALDVDVAISHVAFSADGKWALAAGQPSIQPNHAETITVWKTKATEGRLNLDAHDAGVTRCEFSADGRAIVSASWDSSIEVRSIETGELLTKLTGAHRDDIRDVVVSRDGRYYFSGGGIDGRLVIWDARKQAVEQIIENQPDTIWAVAASADSKFVAAGGQKRNLGWLKVWDVASGKERSIAFSAGHGRVDSIDFSNDGRWIAATTVSGNVPIWSVDTGTMVRVLQGHLNTPESVRFSPDSARLATASKSSLRIWDVETGEQCLRLRHPGAISVAFSPDGDTLLTGSRDGTVRLWNATPLDE